MSDAPPLDCPERFSEEARRAIYEVIALRRDVREFAAGDVDDETLGRILGAAHLAPSVGFSQPWGFVVVRDGARRARIRESFLRCREVESARFEGARRERYLAYRLEGIVEAAVNVCVAVDLRSRGEAILGATVQPEAVRASACCAVQNLWLAARAEGVGVGWVSIIEAAVLREELRLPAGVEPIAYLCVGRPRAFRPRPMLEETGWLPRRALGDAVHREGWNDPPSGEEPSRTGGREQIVSMLTISADPSPRPPPHPPPSTSARVAPPSRTSESSPSRPAAWDASRRSRPGTPASWDSFRASLPSGPRWRSSPRITASFAKRSAPTPPR